MNGNMFPEFLLCGFAADSAFLDLSHSSYQAALSAYPFQARLGKSFLHLLALEFVLSLRVHHTLSIVSLFHSFQIIPT